MSFATEVKKELLGLDLTPCCKKALIAGILHGIGEVAKGYWNGIKDFAKGAWDGIKQIGLSVWDSFKKSLAEIPVIGGFFKNDKKAEPHATGGIVGGNSYSGDNIPIMANAGELVLTKAAQASLANHLEGGGMSGLGPSRISGEQIYITLNRYLKRSGQGELMTWG